MDKVLTHSSVSEELGNDLHGNDRLELYGDAVLVFILTKHHETSIE